LERLLCASATPHGTVRVLDAESCSEGVEGVNKLGQRGKAFGAILRALKRPTQLGTPPVCQRRSTRPHGTERVLDAESCSEGVEGRNKLGQRGNAFGGTTRARKRPTQLGTPPVCQRRSTRPHGTERVLDAESCSEGVESVFKIKERGKGTGTISQTLRRPTQLGTPPVCQRHPTRPHGPKRVLDAESCSDGVESVTNLKERGQGNGAISKALKRPTQLGTTPWASVISRDYMAQGGSRRRVLLGGLGRLKSSQVGLEDSRWQEDTPGPHPRYDGTLTLHHA